MFRLSIEHTADNLFNVSDSYHCFDAFRPPSPSTMNTTLQAIKEVTNSINTLNNNPTESDSELLMGDTRAIDAFFAEVAEGLPLKNTSQRQVTEMATDNEREGSHQVQSLDSTLSSSPMDNMSFALFYHSLDMGNAPIYVNVGTDRYRILLKDNVFYGHTLHGTENQYDKLHFNPKNNQWELSLPSTTNAAKTLPETQATDCTVAETPSVIELKNITRSGLLDFYLAKKK